MTALEVDPRREDDFKAVMGHFATGVVAVTAVEDGGPVGFTCQAFASLSLDPPLVALAPARTSTTFPRIRAAGGFAVNVLSEDQSPLARAFARSGTDKFAGVRWSPGAGGAPILHGAIAWIECRIVAEHEAGDHTLVVARVERAGHLSDGRPLTFYRGAFGGFANEERAPAAAVADGGAEGGGSR